MRFWEDNYFNDEQFQELLHEYEQGLEQGSATYLDVDDLTDIAEYYYFQQKPELAWKVVTQALEQDPQAIAPRTFIMRGYIRNGEWEKVRQMIRETQCDLSEDRELMYIYTELLMHDGKYDEADRLLLSQIPDDSEQEQRIYIREVIGIYLDYESENSNAKIREWGALLQQMSHLETEDKMILGEMYSCTNQHEKAISLLQNVVHEHPYKAQAWLLLAEAFERANQNQQALDAASFALAIKPNDLDSLLVAERCTYAIDAFSDKHAKILADLMNLFPTDPEVLCVCASRILIRFNTSHDVNNLHEGRELLEKAMKYNIDNAADTFNILINLAYTFAAEYSAINAEYDNNIFDINAKDEDKLLSLHDLCINYLNQAHSCDASREDEYRQDIASMYISIGELLKARPHLERDVQLNPDSAQAHHSLGILYIDLQLFPLAISHITKAAELDEELYGAEQHAPLAYCFYILRMKKQCLHHLTQACYLTPEYTAEFFNSIYPYTDPHLYYMFAARDI